MRGNEPSLVSRNGGRITGLPNALVCCNPVGACLVVYAKYDTVIVPKAQASLFFMVSLGASHLRPAGVHQGNAEAVMPTPMQCGTVVQCILPVRALGGSVEFIYRFAYLDFCETVKGEGTHVSANVAAEGVRGVTTV